MRRHTHSAAVALAAVLQAACQDPGRPIAPGGAPAARGADAQGSDSHLAGDRIVTMMDACDPTTFNAVLRDPEACVRNGGVTFQRFVDQLEKHGAVGSWRFSPPEMNVRVGETLVAVNRGGEVHTFTEVEEFGGGIVPLLNQLSGTPVPAPECLELDAADFVPAGGTDRESVSEPGTEHYQCCIHPWMRATVHARGT